MLTFPAGLRFCHKKGPLSTYNEKLSKAPTYLQLSEIDGFEPMMFPSSFKINDTINLISGEHHRLGSCIKIPFDVILLQIHSNHLNAVDSIKLPPGLASHRIGRRFFPRLGTIRWSLNRAFIPSYPIPSSLHPSWKAACPFEYRQQATHTVVKCPWNLQSVSGSSVLGSPHNPTVSHSIAHRIVPSSLTCRGCSHVFSTFIPDDLVVCPHVCRLYDIVDNMDVNDTRARNIHFIGECMAWRDTAAAFQHKKR